MIETRTVKLGTVCIIPANPAYGYNFDYSVFIPNNCNKDTTLIMHCCNTGVASDNLFEACELAKEETFKSNIAMLVGNDLNMPVITPLIPRIKGYHTHALSSKVYNNDVSLIYMSDEEILKIQQQCRNIPLQVSNMIKSSMIFLQNIGINVEDKVIVEGYSAGSKFANGFTALYPELVKACICGGNTGLGILPCSEYEGQQLNFPLGVTDIPSFDYNAFCQVPQLYYMGTEDYNDPAMYKHSYLTDESNNLRKDANGNAIPVTDTNGKIIPLLDFNGRLQPKYMDCYTQDEVIQIHTLLGDNPQTRFDNQEKMYNFFGINANFRKFPGNHTTVTHLNDGEHIYVNECIKKFITETLEKEKSNEDGFKR